VHTAIHQIRRQQLGAFHSELLRTRGIELRDIRPEVIKRRLLSVATSDQTGFLAGGTSAFNSLRQIRKEQQLKKTEAVTALVKAKPYYYPAPTGRRVPQLSRQLADPGGMFVHLRSLLRRIQRIAQPPSARAAYKQCGVAARFRVGDLNGGRLRHGDWVSLRAVHGGYMSMNCDGIIYANCDRAGKAEKFRLIACRQSTGTYPLR
jgi:hypothetical protein